MGGTALPRIAGLSGRHQAAGVRLPGADRSASRAALAAGRGGTVARAGAARAADGRGRHPQGPLRDPRRVPGRGRGNAPSQPAHRLRLVAVGLPARMHVLRYRLDGPWAQPARPARSPSRCWSWPASCATRTRRSQNVVMMGMGEPFLNYDAVLAACRTLNDPDGFGLGARQIAISTAGWIPGIDRLAEEQLQVKLALSLHAPTDRLRETLMPVNRRYPLAELMAACRRYREKTSRRIFVEYLLLDGVNDSNREARAARGPARRRGVPRQPDRLQPDRGRRIRRRRRSGWPLSPRRSPSAASRPATGVPTAATSLRPAASWPCRAPGSSVASAGACSTLADPVPGLPAPRKSGRR